MGEIAEIKNNPHENFEISISILKLEKKVLSAQRANFFSHLMSFGISDESAAKAKIKEIDARKKIDKKLEMIIEGQNRHAAIEYMNILPSISTTCERIKKVYKIDIGIDRFDVERIAATAGSDIMTPFVLVPYVTVIRSSEKNLDAAFAIIKEIKDANEQIIRSLELYENVRKVKDLGVGAPI
ncbi:MAG: hypothetical protein ACP5K9_00875 [Candidatus Micrarchaeia archaeon]